MTSVNNDERANKIKYCKNSLDHLIDTDKKKVLYKTFNVYSKCAPNSESENYISELTKHNQKLDMIFTENAVGTILDLDKLNDEGLDIIYNFIKSDLK